MTLFHISLYIRLSRLLFTAYIFPIIELSCTVKWWRGWKGIGIPDGETVSSDAPKPFHNLKTGNSQSFR